MRILVSPRPRRAIRVERLPERRAAHPRAVGDEPVPVERPTEVAYRLARQPEREVEAADPRPRRSEQLLEARPVGESVDRLHDECAGRGPAARDSDGLARPRGGSEVDAEDAERTTHAYLRTGARRACCSAITPWIVAA